MKVSLPLTIVTHRLKHEATGRAPEMSLSVKSGMV